MTMHGKKLFCLLLTLALLAVCMPALAEATTLKLTFTGMYAASDGTYTAVPLSGVFEVYQGDMLLGELDVTPEGGNTIALTGTGDVRLVPVADTLPAGITLSEYGYSLSVTEGRMNIAPLTVYAEAGLFTLTGDPLADYALLDSAGDTALTFRTDANGDYALDVAIAAGAYTLTRMDAPSAWQDQTVVIPVYTGALSVAHVSAACAESASPTPAPTEAPTPTPAPTETPIPAAKEGTLVLTAVGANVPLTYTVTSGNDAVAQGSLALNTPVRLEGLAEGEYTVTLMLPERSLLVRLNGNATKQSGTARWRVAVSAAKESSYILEMAYTASIMVPFVNVSALAVNACTDTDFVDLSGTEGGVYYADSLIPGIYTISATLPAARYSFDASRWNMLDNGDGTYTALLTLTLSGGESAVLPPITRVVSASASGTVLGLDGAPLSGVEVTLYDADEQAVISLNSGADGSWGVSGLTYGTYSVQYAYEGMAFPASTFTVSDEANTAAVRVTAGKPAKITVRAFLDENNNGSLSNGEHTVADVEVSLLSPDGIVVATALTDKNGSATLTAPAGTYSLRATAPAHYGYAKTGSKTGINYSIMAESAERTQISSPLTLSADAPLEVGIGLQTMACVTGTVWNDLNADGVWQSDEPGIPGIRVTIEGKRNGVSAEVYTDENGYYELTQLKAGAYVLTCHVPDEYVFTVKAKGDAAKISRMTTEASRAGTDEFSLERGQTRGDRNIGMMEGAIIEGICFLDENCNGVYDEGERTLAGVELKLARQSNNVLLQETVSDENGRYHFYGQRGSTFAIRAKLPSGYVFSITGTGENANRFAPNGKNTERRLTDITLENGGYQQILLGAVTYGSISGRVYYDENFSGAWESGEKVGAGFTVTLADANGTAVATQKTDKNGLFSFSDLNPGQYTLRMTPAQGYAFTAAGSGNVMATLADGTGESSLLTLRMGSDLTDVGIGMIVPAKVSGVLFADDNDNGLLDAGEGGLRGTVIRLMSESGEAASITLGDSSAFAFNAVLPGTYYLRYELPSGGVFSPIVSGGNTLSGEDGTAVTDWFSVSVGASYTLPVGGASILSSISGFAFADANGNGVWDADEAFLSGMQISLTPADPAHAAQACVTGADGQFAMDGIRPGEYTLSVACPDACVLSRMPNASLGLTHGLNAQRIQLTIPMGTQLTGQQLGCVLPSKWTGVAYLDENYDGVRAANEAPAAGETLILRDADTGATVSTVVTDENGAFTIEGIAPGEYELVYPLDDGSLIPKGGDSDLHLNGNEMTTGRVRINENEDKAGTVVSVARLTEISGKVWLEKDGILPVPGAKVLLLDSTGAQLDAYTTGEDGLYRFTGLMPGDYSLDVTVPSGYTLVESTDAHLDEAGLISVVALSDGVHGVSEVFTLRMAQHRLAMDIGNVLPGRLGDKVWLDLNGNGLQDGEEGGIPGVVIELMRGDRVVATATSDQYGYYCFEDLYPTEYVLRVTWPEEVTPTQLRTDVHQISSVLQENGLSIPVTVESSKANYAADLGFVLVEEGTYPAGYGEGAKQVWKK